MESLEVKGITQRYYDSDGNLFTALEDVSLRWERGQSIAVMGERGSGKSTLARLMVGLEKPVAGEIAIDGQSTRGWSNRQWRRCRTDLQAVFQDERGTLSPGRSVMQNAEEALCNLTNMNRKQRESHIRELMARLGLDEKLLETPVRMLSGGEQRRIGLLRALAVRPAFLILDEVTASLDLLSTDAVVRLLQAYQKEHDCGYLLITHDRSVAARLCSHMIEIDHGHIFHEVCQ